MSLARKCVPRRDALRTLLIQARSRLKPQDVGLPAIGLRRVPGLRQAEVAELAGVSTRWYEHFEDGTSDRRFSIGFIERVANALCLNDKERSMLFRLALPEVRAAVEQVEQSENDGALWGLSRTCDFARRLTTVNSFDEAAQVAAETVQAILSPSCVSSVALLPSHQRRIIAFGPKAEFANSAFADTCIAANYPNRLGYTAFNESRPGSREEVGADNAIVLQWQTSEGRSFIIKIDDSPTKNDQAARRTGMIHDLNLSASVFWSWNVGMKSRSSLTHGLFALGVYHGNLGALWTEPHAMSPFEIETIKTACALVELASAGPAFPR